MKKLGLIAMIVLTITIVITSLQYCYTKNEAVQREVDSMSNVYGTEQQRKIDFKSASLNENELLTVRDLKIKECRY